MKKNLNKTQTNNARLANLLVMPPWMWFAYRLATIAGGTAIGVFSLWLGYLLIQQGATGEFTLSGEGKDIKGFLTSTSPGIILAFFGCVVTTISYFIQIKAWGVQTPDQIKERGNIKYYPWS